MSDWTIYLLFFLGGIVAQVVPMLVCYKEARKVVCIWLRLR